MPTPLFPLHMVLFPGATLPLHVFELRYRLMMDQVLEGDRRFVVAAIRQGMEVGGPAEVYGTATLAQIEQVQRSEEGRMAIVVRGIKRVRVVTRLPDDPFPAAEVEPLSEQLGLDADRAMTRARAAVHRYLSAVAKLRGTEVTAPALGEDDAINVSFVLAEVLHIDLPDRQRLLEAPDAAARLSLVEQLARDEARLLDMVGPSVGRPTDSISLN
ncbi:MAG TPA: LON peptidase substrate-binding domain-containing protein [Actinomycetota bacterium]